MTELVSHPIANIFPMMPPDQYEALKEDIRVNGLRSCGTLYEGQILDGRNRYKACQELGIRLDWEDCDLMEPEDLAKFDPVQFVISHNLHRRHLTTAQRSMIAAKMATIKSGAIGNGRKVGPQNCEATRDDAAKLLNVSPRSIDTAKHVIEHGSKELVEAVERGDVTVSLADKLCKTVDDKRQQSKIVKQGAKAVKEAVKPPREPEPKTRVKLPQRATSSEVAEVDTWIESQDERPVVERFRVLWAAADDVGKAAIRALVMEWEATQ